VSRPRRVGGAASPCRPLGELADRAGSLGRFGPYANQLGARVRSLGGRGWAGQVDAAGVEEHEVPVVLEVPEAMSAYPALGVALS
jgi:hypothetical protein